MISSSKNAWNSTFFIRLCCRYASSVLPRSVLCGMFNLEIDQFVVSSLVKNARLGLNGMQRGWLHFEWNQETISQKLQVTRLLHCSQNELEYSLLRIAQFSASI